MTGAHSRPPTARRVKVRQFTTAVLLGCAWISAGAISVLFAVTHHTRLLAVSVAAFAFIGAGLVRWVFRNSSASRP